MKSSTSTLSGYNVFMKEMSKQLREGGEKGFTEISSKVSAMWKNAEEQERKRYKDMAESLNKEAKSKLEEAKVPCGEDEASNEDDEEKDFQPKPAEERKRRLVGKSKQIEESKRTKMSKKINKAVGKKQLQPKEKETSPGSKRGQSPFFLYLKENRESLIQENPGITSKDISRLAGEKWRALEKSEQEKYAAKAKAMTSENHQAA